MSALPLYITAEPNDRDLAKQLPSAIPYELRCGDINHQGLWTNGDLVWIWGGA